MCGICGFIKINEKARDLTSVDIDTMNQQMIKRGPDAGAVWVDEYGRCGLGHRRLAIIDLSDEAIQPMSNESGDIVLVYNGEIYNHFELRKELNSLAQYKWKTDHSDTEVIIHAYEQWGIDCIKRFRGMFAFALWDKRQECLFLVRDRIGIKPLYYTYESGNLIFASEIKALLPIVTVGLKMNKRAVYDYLSFLCAPNEETLFDSIYKIRPATVVCVKTDGRVSKEKYWEVLKHTHSELYKASDEEIREALLYELEKSVNYRKEADVPVGVFLSGGIDSSTNCALFSKEQSSSVKTFCIGYDDPLIDYHNENEYAKIVADYCGAEFYEKLLSQKNWIESVDEIMWLLDEPIADPTAVPSYFVSKMARNNGIIVAQVGEGSDELFCGYPSWGMYEKIGQFSRIEPWRCPKKIVLELLYRTGRGARLYTELIRRSYMKEPIFWSGAEAFYEYDKRNMISNTFKKALGDYNTFSAIKHTYDTFKKYAWEKSDYNWMSYVDLNHRLPELLLMRVDKMSMGVSLECRVPFLDHKFVELAMSIPTRKKVENGVTKKILKDSIRGVVPDLIIDRPKVGFGIPIKGWLNDILGAKMKETISEFLEGTDLFNSDYVISIYNRNNPIQLWCLYNLANWWKIYIA